MSESAALIPLPEQRLARTALNRLTKPAREGKGRLLYLVGSAGCGKSALIREFVSSIDCRVVTGSEFAAQLADASSQDRLSEFQERFRSVSVFVCEDIHALAGRTHTLQQFLATIDDLLSHGHDVVVSSTKRPGQLGSFPMKLVNRLRGGTILPVKQPGPDSRTELLRLFVRQRKLTLPRDVFALLSDSRSESPRELAGLVNQLAARRQPIKRADVEEFVKADAAPTSISMNRISRAVTQEFGVTLSSLRSRRRSQALVLPRQCAMWLCRKLCHASYPEIGEFFQRRHSSVLHAIKMLDTRLAKQPVLRQRLLRLEAACR